MDLPDLDLDLPDLDLVQLHHETLWQPSPALHLRRKEGIWPCLSKRYRQWVQEGAGMLAPLLLGLSPVRRHPPTPALSPPYPLGSCLALP